MGAQGLVSLMANPLLQSAAMNRLRTVFLMAAAAGLALVLPGVRGAADYIGQRSGRGDCFAQ